MSRTTRCAASIRCRCPLCGTSAATLPDEGRLVWQPEGLVDDSRAVPPDVLDVDAFVDRHRAALRHTVGKQHLPDGLRRGDEAVHLPMFPARERIAAQVEVDAACGNKSGLADAVARAPVPSESASAAIATPCASCACIDVRGEPADHARQDARPPTDPARCAERSESGRGLRRPGGGARRRGGRRARRAGRWPAGHSTVSSTWFWPPRHVRAVSMWRENIHGSAVRGSGLRVMLWSEFPELRKLEEHVVAVHRRDDQAGGTVAKAAA